MKLFYSYNINYLLLLISLTVYVNASEDDSFKLSEEDQKKFDLIIKDFEKSISSKKIENPFYSNNVSFVSPKLPDITEFIPELELPSSLGSDFKKYKKNPQAEEIVKNFLLGNITKATMDKELTKIDFDINEWKNSTNQTFSLLKNDVNKEVNSKNTSAKILNEEELAAKLNSNSNSNKDCYEVIKRKLKRLMELVWPTLSEGKKKVILKNKSCNTFIRDKIDEYPGFKILSQSYIPRYLIKYSKSLVDHFLELCKNGISEKNSLDLFLQSLKDPNYGPLLASLLKLEPLLSPRCGDLKVEFSEVNNESGYYRPEINELPVPFDQTTFLMDKIGYFSIKGITQDEIFPKLFQSYRSGTITSKERRHLTNELATVSPIEGEEVVWRRADTAFDNIPFDDLVKDKVYVELAPTCTSRDNPLCWKKKGLIRIKLPPNLSVARSIQLLSSLPDENEVLIPPNSCFKYLGSSREVPPEHEMEELIYDFVLVPWFEMDGYGYYSRELAILESNKYYGRRFKKGDDSIVIGKTVVKRPNHGLTHGVRQAYMALDLLSELANSANKYGPLGEWAKELLKKDDEKSERRREILFLMALHFRAGRLSEQKNFFPEYVSHIKKILKKSQLTSSQEEIDNLADLYSEKPNLNSNDKKYMMMVLDVAHRTDHLRQNFWKVEESEKDLRWSIGNNGEQSLENQSTIIEFLQSRAEIYLKATGAFNILKDKEKSGVVNIGPYSFTDPKLFAELENNPKKLYKIMEQNCVKIP